MAKPIKPLRPLQKPPQHTVPSWLQLNQDQFRDWKEELAKRMVFCQNDPYRAATFIYQLETQNKRAFQMVALLADKLAGYRDMPGMPTELMDEIDEMLKSIAVVRRVSVDSIKKDVAGVR